MEKDTNIFDTVKDEMRKMKNSLIENKDSKEPDIALFTNKGQYYEQHRSRSPYKDRQRDYYDRSRSRSQSYNDSYRKRQENNRSRSRSFNDTFRKGPEIPRTPSKLNEGFIDSDSPKQNNYSQNRDSSAGRTPQKKYHYKYHQQHFTDSSEITSEDTSNDVINVFIAHNDTINKGIIDSGCTKAVMGKKWFEIYVSGQVERGCNQDYKPKQVQEHLEFGDGPIYKATQMYKIPLKIGNFETSIDVCVVDCNIPLLISKQELDDWRVLHDYHKNTLYIGRYKETIKLERTKSGHSAILLGVHEKNVNIFYTNKYNTESYKAIKKVHRVLGHPKEVKLCSLYRSKNALTPTVNKIIKKVCSQCNICKRFNKSQPRPKVGLPKATSFNECVSLDLKNVSSLLEDPNDKRMIVYMTDEFTKYTKGKIIQGKTKEKVLEAILKEWGTKFCGLPKKSFHCDNGGEFRNELLMNLCNKEGIKLTFSPAYSPWSNGGNERRHSTVDITIKKLKADNPSLKLEEALDIALSARNNEIGPHGFSPAQLVFGEGTTVIGITDGNAATDEKLTDSEALHRHFKLKMDAVETFRNADSSDRLKRALKSRIPAYNDEIYQPGDKILFQDENNKWTGPATVIDQAGRTVSYIWNGTRGRSTHVCRAQRYYTDEICLLYTSPSPRDS